MDEEADASDQQAFYIFLAPIFDICAAEGIIFQATRKNVNDACVCIRRHRTPYTEELVKIFVVDANEAAEALSEQDTGDAPLDDDNQYVDNRGEDNDYYLIAPNHGLLDGISLDSSGIVIFSPYNIMAMPTPCAFDPELFYPMPINEESSEFNAFVDSCKAAGEKIVALLEIRLDNTLGGGEEDDISYLYIRLPSLPNLREKYVDPVYVATESSWRDFARQHDESARSWMKHMLSKVPLSSVHDEITDVIYTLQEETGAAIEIKALQEATGAALEWCEDDDKEGYTPVTNQTSQLAIADNVQSEDSEDEGDVPEEGCNIEAQAADIFTDERSEAPTIKVVLPPSNKVATKAQDPPAPKIKATYADMVKSTPPNAATPASAASGAASKKAVPPKATPASAASLAKAPSGSGSQPVVAGKRTYAKILTAKIDNGVAIAEKLESMLSPSTQQMRDAVAKTSKEQKLANEGLAKKIEALAKQISGAKGKKAAATSPQLTPDERSHIAGEKFASNPANAASMVRILARGETLQSAQAPKASNPVGPRARQGGKKKAAQRGGKAPQSAASGAVSYAMKGVLSQGALDELGKVRQEALLIRAEGMANSEMQFSRKKTIHPRIKRMLDGLCKGGSIRVCSKSVIHIWPFTDQVYSLAKAGKIAYVVILYLYKPDDKKLPHWRVHITSAEQMHVTDRKGNKVLKPLYDYFLESRAQIFFAPRYTGQELRALCKMSVQSPITRTSSKELEGLLESFEYWAKKSYSSGGRGPYGDYQNFCFFWSVPSLAAQPAPAMANAPTAKEIQDDAPISHIGVMVLPDLDTRGFQTMGYMSTIQNMVDKGLTDICRCRIVMLPRHPEISPYRMPFLWFNAGMSYSEGTPDVPKELNEIFTRHLVMFDGRGESALNSRETPRKGKAAPGLTDIGSLRASKKAHVIVFVPFAHFFPTIGDKDGLVSKLRHMVKLFWIISAPQALQKFGRYFQSSVPCQVLQIIEPFDKTGAVYNIFTRYGIKRIAEERDFLAQRAKDWLAKMQRATDWLYQEVFYSIDMTIKFYMLSGKTAIECALQFCDEAYSKIAHMNPKPNVPDSISNADPDIVAYLYETFAFFENNPVHSEQDLQILITRHWFKEYTKLLRYIDAIRVMPYPSAGQFSKEFLEYCLCKYGFLLLEVCPEEEKRALMNNTIMCRLGFISWGGADYYSNAIAGKYKDLAEECDRFYSVDKCDDSKEVPPPPPPPSVPPEDSRVEELSD